LLTRTRMLHSFLLSASSRVNLCVNVAIHTHSLKRCTCESSLWNVDNMPARNNTHSCTVSPHCTPACRYMRTCTTRRRIAGKTVTRTLTLTAHMRISAAHNFRVDVV
jgi:hypothetical protein